MGRLKQGFSIAWVKMYQHYPPSFVMIPCSPSSSLGWIIWSCRYADCKKEVCCLRNLSTVFRPQKGQPPVCKLINWHSSFPLSRYFGLCDFPPVLVNFKRSNKVEFLKLLCWGHAKGRWFCWAMTACLVGLILSSAPLPHGHLWRFLELRKLQLITTFQRVP